MSEIRSQATPARDELAEKVFDLLVTAEAMGEQRRNVIAHAIAIGLEDAGWSKPRTVNSAAELDALPNMTVVMDNCDDVSQKRGGQWCGYETADLTSKQIAKYGPLTVLFTPGDAG